MAAVCRQLPIVPNRDIETARVCLDGRNLRMEINPRFWMGLTEDDRTFVLGHEAFHVALGHISRGRGYPQQIMNVAADAVTNDWLLNELGLEISDALRSQVITMESLDLEDCSGRSMEHVMSNLHFSVCMKALRSSRWVGDHKPCGEVEAEGAIREIMNRMSREERQDIGWSPYANTAHREEVKQASMHAAGAIVRMLTRGRHGTNSSTQHTWIREPRRMSSGLLMPDTADIKNTNGCHVRFYLDSSGSMNGLEGVLVGCTEELERKDISVSRFWFDTQVHGYEKRVRFGGGGTDFGIVSRHADANPKFDLAIVLTDGFAPQVQVKDKSRWLWLITDGGSSHAVQHMRWKPVSWAFRLKSSSW